MLLHHLLAFDDTISGTSTSWYSPQSLNEALGECELIGLHAFTTSVSGTAPTLTIHLDMSADDQNWLLGSGGILLTAVAITSDSSRYGSSRVLSPKFTRARITLGGTNPACRLKVFITGRAYRS